VIAKDLGILIRKPFGVSGNTSQKGLRHLASCRVARTQEQHAFLHVVSFAGEAVSAAGEGWPNNRNAPVAAPAPSTWAMMNPGTSAGRMPENVSVMDRASVADGFAKAVEDVNQYAAVM
jgi:hypothetical protein